MRLSQDIRTIFEITYDKYADMLYRIALSHTQSREDAEDAVHDVFIKYIMISSRFSDDEHERAFLIRATINRCHDILRRNKIREHDSLEDITNLLSEESKEPLELFSVLSMLSEKYRTVIILHYLEGFSVEEISKMLRLSPSATKMRLSRGRKLLKNLITDEEKRDV